MALFQVGKTQITASAQAALSDAACSAISLLTRHESGDWGDVEARVAAANEFAIAHEHTMHLITSQYRLGSGEALAMITSSDRAVTRIQLSSEQTTEEVDSVEGYERWAETYDLELNPLIAVEGPRVQALLDQIPMRTALDAGAGTGRHAIALAQRGVAVTAVDQSPDMLAVAREKAARAGLDIDFRMAASRIAAAGGRRPVRLPGLRPDALSRFGHRTRRQGVRSGREAGRLDLDLRHSPGRCQWPGLDGQASEARRDL